MRLPVTRVATPIGALCLGVVLVLVSVPGQAGEVSKSVPFELDRWVELEATDGPVTLHRIRLHRVSGGMTKSKLFRPGNDEFLETVRIELEYSNQSGSDWEVDIDLRWVDEAGRTIDGYHDEEDLDNDERYDDATVTLSTLRYGLERATTLELSLDFYRE